MTAGGRTDILSKITVIPVKAILHGHKTPLSRQAQTRERTVQTPSLPSISTAGRGSGTSRYRFP